MSFDDRLRMTLTVKRSEPLTSGGGETLGGADTTLTADTAPGAAQVIVTSETGISPDDWLRIGDEGETEVRQVASVAEVTIALTVPLSLSHDAGDQVRELDDAGDPALDELGQPLMGETTVAAVPGLIQPRTAREVALSTQGGAAIGRHVAYLRPLTGLTTRDWIEHAGLRYDIIAIADAAGLGHHLELGLEQVS